MLTRSSINPGNLSVVIPPYVPAAGGDEPTRKRRRSQKEPAYKSIIKTRSQKLREGDQKFESLAPVSPRKVAPVPVEDTYWEDVFSYVPWIIASVSIGSMVYLMWRT
jgi:hypothetical protein